MGIEPAPRFVMVLYVSEDSATCERAVANVHAAVRRLGLESGAWTVRNVSTEPLADHERAAVVLTPMLVVTEPRPVCLTGDLDDIEALDAKLRPLLQPYRRGNAADLRYMS
jgi:hypothetical protein